MAMQARKGYVSCSVVSSSSYTVQRESRDGVDADTSNDRDALR